MGTERVDMTTHYPVSGRVFVDEVFNQLWACGYTSATECEPFINEIRTGEYDKMIIHYGSHFVKWVMAHTLAPNGSRPSIRTLTTALRDIRDIRDIKE